MGAADSSATSSRSSSAAMELGTLFRLPLKFNWAEGDWFNSIPPKFVILAGMEENKDCRFSI